MLRSVDGWEGEHFAFGEANASPAAVPTSVAIDNGAGGPTATIPDAHLLFTAQFARAGADLVLHGDDGKAYVIHDYFATDDRARLMSPEGAALSPQIVDALVGPQAPGQFAQAAATPSAAQAVGRVAVVTGDATIVRNGVAIAANAGDAILKGDVLQTVSGTIGVTFSDGSTLNLTANTRLVVNEFVYSPQGSQNSQLLDLVQGSLTFISGEIAHNGDMRIGTPVATMGIRGTVGGVTTANDGTVNFYVSQSTTGAVILDSRGTIIANVVQDGPLIIVRPVGPLQVLAEEVQKSPAQLATELAALQQIVNIQSIGQQIIQQFFQQDPTNNPNPNPQSTDKPITHIQIFNHQNNSTPSGEGGANDAPPPPLNAATVTTTTPNPDGTQTTHTETVTFVPNVAPNKAPVLTLSHSAYVADRFDSIAYNLNSGSMNWASNWTEVNDTNSAATGEIWVTADRNANFALGDYRLLLSDDDGESGDPDTVQREANLTGAVSATLSFDYRRDMPYGTGSDLFRVYLSNDGEHFTEIATIGGDDFVDGAYSNFSFALTANLLSAHTTVRFSVGDEVNNGNLSLFDVVYIDNIKIDYVLPATSYAINYVENGAPLPISATGNVLDDDDDMQMQSATIKLDNPKTGDLLSVIGTLPGGITPLAAYNSMTGILTLTGAATLAEYAAALHQVGFSSTGDNQGYPDRTMHITVFDGADYSNTVNVTVHVNDLPEAQDDHLIFAADNVIAFEQLRYISFPFDFLAVNDDPDGSDVFTSADAEPNDAFIASSLYGASVGLGFPGVVYQLGPNQSPTFEDSFTYDISNDGQGHGTRHPATVTLSVVNSLVLEGDLNSNRSEIIVGGLSDENMTGHGGADGFVFLPAPGNDTITDFTPGVDKIVIANFYPDVPLQYSGMSAWEAAFLLNPDEHTFEAWKDRWAVDTDNHSVTFALHYDSMGAPTDTVTLANVSLSSIHVNDFIVHNLVGAN